MSPSRVKANNIKNKKKGSGSAQKAKNKKLN